MEANTLCSLIAQRINPEHFIVSELEVVFIDPDRKFKPSDAPNTSPYNTVENRAIVADVIKNYDALAAAYESKKSILAQIKDLELQQTPRRLREAIADPTWMNGLDSQIAELRAQL